MTEPLCKADKEAYCQQAKRRAEIEKKAEEKDLEERERLKEENRKERQEQRERERKIKERLLRKYAEVEAKITVWKISEPAVGTKASVDCLLGCPEENYCEFLKNEDRAAFMLLACEG